LSYRTASPPAVITGVHAARLRETIAASPTSPIVAGVLGVGGYGKTALLGQLAGIYRDAGAHVVDDGTVSDPGDGVLLVDDAHRLGESELRELCLLAQRTDIRLVVTYRPWPRPPELQELISVLGRSGPPVLLPAFGSAEIACLLERQLGTAASPDWIEWFRAQTGGVPRFVTGAISALTPQDLTHARLPQQALAPFHHDLDLFDDSARAVLTAVAAGAAPHPDLLAAVLGLSPTTVSEAMAAVRASGFVDVNDMLLPIARHAVLLLTPWERRFAVQRRLIEIQLARGGPVLPLVLPLLNAEVSLLPESTMATAFERAGDEALAESPGLAGRLFDAAVSAGTAPNAVAARRAQAAAAAGDLDAALRLSDQVIVDDSVPDRAVGVQVAASVLAHRGLLTRAAELCRWSVEHVRWPGDVAFAVVGLIGSGRLEEAEELLRGPGDSGPPTSSSGAATQLAEGVRESVVGSATAALSTLLRSASLSESMGRTALIPDSPASIAAVVASHCGEFDVAESLLDRAVDAGIGGPLLQVRHRLLAAWAPLSRGDTVSARARLAATAGGPLLHARDRLLQTAVEAGIANRDNDVAALSELRGRVRKAVAEHPVDLFALLPLGELLVAAARLRDQDWLAPYLQEARSLLARLGNPPLWNALLQWKCLQSAVVLDDLESAREHAAELEAIAHHNPMSAAMSDAALTWLGILGDNVDPESAERAARGLHAAGLAWDGARLAGQAAIRTHDRRAMLALLERARALQGKPPRPRAVAGAESSSPGTSAPLSEREKEVAELVVAGLTYKQVGKRLFISAKTVEHHISRIKHRLGCADREELLGRLRQLLQAET
jgi:DNA-binding CsgD family transcriptional regulator